MSKQDKEKRPNVAIVGGGIAGLTAAYRLAQQGVRVTVFEAKDRLGGKIHTSDQYRAARAFEFGAEFINSDDTALIHLCHELGVHLQETTAGSPEFASDYAYLFNGERYSDTEVQQWYDHLVQHIRPILDEVQTDKKVAKFYDQLPLSRFLEQMKQCGVNEHLLEIYTTIYTHENGNRTDFQSTLGFLKHLNVDSQDFSLFGVDDEAYWVRGGTSCIIAALAERCKALGVDIYTGTHVREAHKASGGKVALSLNAEADKKTFDHVVFATSLPLLNQVGGLKELGFSDNRLHKLRSMQHTNALKISFPLKGDPRRGTPLEGIPSFVTDKRFQVCWHVTGDDGLPLDDPRHNSMVVMLVGGINKMTDISVLVEDCKEEYARLLGKPPAQVFQPVAPEFTLSYGPTNGCYVSPAPGQYRRLDKIGHKQLQGPATLIGGHMTVAIPSGGIKMGFMECAVQSAETEAERLVSEKFRHRLRVTKHNTHPRITATSGDEQSRAVC